MRRFVPIRLLAVGLAVGSMTAIPFAEAASAAVVPVTCTKLTAPAPAKGLSTGTISGCTNAAATGGGGKQVTNIAKLTFVITWNAKKGTTTAKISYKAGPKVNKCAKGSTLIVATGTTTGGTGAALKAIPKGSKYSESVCYDAKQVTSIEPGTKMVI
jgi:hypothetical protein